MFDRRGLFGGNVFKNLARDTKGNSNQKCAQQGKGSG